MKKLISVLLALVSVICVSFAFAGCGDEKLEEGTFYTVIEAYESGYLTREDVMSIAYYHNGGREHNEEIMDENYTPLPKTPEELSPKTEAAIKQTYFNTYQKRLSGKDLEIRIDEYDGTYGNCVVVMMLDSNCGFWDVIEVETVENIKIYYNNSNNLKIWINTK